ncbi:uncharacterized protein ACO6RY_16380 [Pungitius sinensis]
MAQRISSTSWRSRENRRTADKLRVLSVTMPDSIEAMPAPCHVIKEDVNKCVRENGAEGCKDLIDALLACIKTLSEGS